MDNFTWEKSLHNERVNIFPRSKTVMKWERKYIFVYTLSHLWIWKTPYMDQY